MNFDFGEVLSRAWEIAWRHKVLWIFGFIQTMAGFLLLPLAVIPVAAPLLSDPSGGILNEPWFFPLFIAGFLIFMLLLYPLNVLLNGALSVGVLHAERGEEAPSFAGLVRESLPFFWRLLALMLLFTGGMLLVMFIFFTLQGFLSILTLGLAAMCTAPLSLLTYPLFFVWYVWMEQSMAATIADNMNAMDAAKQGWEIFRNNMSAIVVIGLVLYFGMSLIGGVAMTPLILPFFAVPFAVGLEEFRNGIFLFAGLCAVVYVPLFAVFQGALMALMKSGWILTYLRLTGSPKLQTLLVEATS